MPRHPKLSLIGSGAVGSTLALALSKKGYPVVSIINRSGKSAKLLGAKLRCQRISTSVEDLSRETQVLLIAVPDDALAEVAASVAKVKTMRPRGLAALHVSGVHSSEILSPLRKKGAICASLHPIQSFPASQPLTRRLAHLRDITYGVQGDDDGLAIATMLAKDLGGKSIVIPAGMKPLYHAACVVASNCFTVLLNGLKELSDASGIYHSWTEVFGPLLTTTMENAVQSGPAESLTGPVVRRDIATLELHLDALSRQAPQLLPLYTICGIEAGRIARRTGRMSDEEYRDLVALFSRRIKSMPSKKQ